MQCTCELPHLVEIQFQDPSIIRKIVASIKVHISSARYYTVTLFSKTSMTKLWLFYRTLCLGNPNVESSRLIELKLYVNVLQPCGHPDLTLLQFFTNSGCRVL
jgi:hypothetical protein